MTKLTDEGHAKISTLNDVLDTIITHSNINKFEYYRTFSVGIGIFEVVLMDNRTERKYGSFLISKRSLERIKGVFGKMVEFEEVGVK